MCTAEDGSVGSSWSVFYSLSLTLNCKHPSQRDFSEKLVEVVMLRWSPPLLVKRVYAGTRACFSPSLGLLRAGSIHRWLNFLLRVTSRN